MEKTVVNIESLVKYQIVICTNDNPKAISDAVNRVLAQLIDAAENATKESGGENHE